MKQLIFWEKGEGKIENPKEWISVEILKKTVFASSVSKYTAISLLFEIIQFRKKFWKLEIQFYVPDAFTRTFEKVTFFLNVLCWPTVHGIPSLHYEQWY